MTCIYITEKDNESVKLLNDNIYNKYTIKIKIDEEKIDKTNTYTFSKAGKHSVTFEFKEKIESLEKFSEGLDKLIEVDLSKLIFEENKITSVQKLFSNCINLKKINININIDTKLENTAEMFYNCKSLENIDFLKDLDTSNVLNMSNMFSGSSSLNTEEISIKTNKVTDMSRMFYKCVNLTLIKNLDISTSEVTNFLGMFEKCENLKNIDLSKFDTSKAINLENFFSGCVSLISIDFSKFQTSNVVDMSGFLTDCRNLNSLDLTTFDTSKVTDISGMFSNCEKLISLDLNNFNTENVVDMDELFLGCVNLKNLNIKNFNYDKVEDMSYMFSNCEKLENIKLSNTSNTFKNLKTIQNICYGCSSLKIFDFNVNENSEESLINITDLSSAFADCGNLTQMIISNINSKNNLNMNNMFLNCVSLKRMDFSPLFIYNDKIKVSNMRKIFKNCVNLTSVEFSILSLSTVYDFSEAFYGCISLTEIDLSGYNYKNTYYMDRMFYGCTNLKIIKLPQSMANLINAKNIFESCETLQSINLENFEKSEKLINISGMFKNCSSLNNVIIPKMKTNYLLNMDEMFYGCSNLSFIDFNDFHTDRIKSMQKTFYNCSSLEYLKIDSFIISEPINIKDIFTGIPLGNVTVESDSNNLFEGLNEEIKNINKTN